MLYKEINMIIGIGGISRAGKTTLALKLKEYYMNDGVKIFHLDKYTIPWNQIPKIGKMIDWEDPISINFNKLEQDIIESLKDNKIIIAEGFLIYYHQPIRDLFDIKIYLSISKDIFITRRKRQYNEPAWYIEHIWNSYHKNHNKFRKNCEIKLDENSDVYLDTIKFLQRQNHS